MRSLNPGIGSCLIGKLPLTTRHRGSLGTVLLFLATSAAALFFCGCGGENEPEEPLESSELLPGRIDPPGFERTSEVETYVGEALYEYINGGAEVYHQYHFVEVSAAYYAGDQVELVVDIYRFEDDVYAFGLYSSLRPAKPEVIELGVEGFTSGTTIDFVKGSYLVRLVAYEESPKVASALVSLAKAFEKLVPGDTTLPRMFSLFPADCRMEVSERFYSESFMGQKILTGVYTVDCSVANETITLFLSPDESGDKFAAWHERAPQHKVAASVLSRLPFDSGKVFIAEDPYYGQILAGVKGSMLCGIVGYDERYEQILIDWLAAIK